ncbi:hypothetical protein KAF25_006867 [Fusarium avenaceum]|uniref:Amine oxidase domain-containing protein n=1 Tax=Fusarium avenaceum TaxID=40199 RepID=A0A9P7KMQ0_9HYPO|nr:hypothetical protein KAF25_006867 [Fusarium avenaceum]
MAKRAEYLSALPVIDPALPVPGGLRVAFAKHLLFNHFSSLCYYINEDVGPGEGIPTLGALPSHGHDDPLSQLDKYLNIENVDIYEAADRVGGRVHTFHFPKDDKYPNPHDYYDIGAMRIPEIDAMESTLNLVNHLELPKKSYVLSTGCEPHIYWYSSEKSPNGDRYFKVLDKIIAEHVMPGQTKFEKWVKEKDVYSTRAYLMFQEKESTGLFDQSIVESLCDYSDFQASATKPWHRIENGMSTVTDKMEECIGDPDWVSHNDIKLQVKKKCPVTAMKDNVGGEKIEVTVSESGKTRTEAYDMVFSTTAMGPLQRMDLKGMVDGFGPSPIKEKVLNGIRALSYDRSCKVAVKFKTRWWKDMYNNSEQKIGGVSGSDMPVSNVVYPSWDDGDKSAVLMVSYTWAQDATRMGSLIPDYSKQDPSIDDAVVAHCFEDLAKLWAKTNPKITIGFLRGEYVTHHAYAWSHDPYTSGAFALFGPGQFKYIYPEFQFLFCEGKFAICGEALSPHHAWISGALDSAYTSLMRWLVHRKDTERADALRESWFGNGVGKHVAEYDEELM